MTFEKFTKDAESMFQDKRSIDEFLQKLEEILKKIPCFGRELAYVPVLISLLRAYLNGEYRSISKQALITVLAALLYLLCPLDAVPDAIPVAGMADDAAVIVFAYNLIKDNLSAFKQWQDAKRVA